MKNLIVLALKKNDFPMFLKLWNAQSLYTKKYETEVWVDDEGNTLAHYACVHHDSRIWEFAKTKPINLKHLNKDGKAPIHTFVECSFVHKITETNKSFKEKIFFYWIEILDKIKFLSSSLRQYIVKKHNKDYQISISFNKEILKDLVDNGADINQFIDYPDRKELGWTSTDYGSFSIKHHLGSPLEILVYSFWAFSLYKSVRQKNFKVIEEYNAFFHALTHLGANPNLIVQGNTNDKNITDAMTSYPSRIVSIFFAKFITNEIEYLAIRPFLSDEHTDFMAVDDHGNTILHSLFARVSSKKHQFSDEFCEEMIRQICQNKNLSIEALHLNNHFNMTPITLLRGEAGHLQKFLEAFILSEKLNRTLDKKSEVNEKRGSRKI